MCEAVGHEVRRLVRTRIGPVADSGLAPGSWRELTSGEVRSLAVAAHRNEQADLGHVDDGAPETG
jgi:23S rRNA pseudouridine2605 synthase